MEKFNLPNIDHEKSILKTIQIKLVTLNKIEEYQSIIIFQLID